MKLKISIKSLLILGFTSFALINVASCTEKDSQPQVLTQDYISQNIIGSWELIKVDNQPPIKYQDFQIQFGQQTTFEGYDPIFKEENTSHKYKFLKARDKGNDVDASYRIEGNSIYIGSLMSTAVGTVGPTYVSPFEADGDMKIQKLTKKSMIITRGGHTYLLKRMNHDVETM